MAKTDKFSIIRDDPQLRPVFEALLVDPKTPEQVFVDLFGVDMEFVKAYKMKFQGHWDLPRLSLFKYISNITQEGVRSLYEDVFNGGWEVLDSLYNRGKNVDAADSALKILKVSAVRGAVAAVRGDKVDASLLSAAKSVIGSVAVYKEIQEGSTEEDWQLMVEEINERQQNRKISPVTKKAYDMVMDNFKNKKIQEEEN